jgi:hypothetical protein
MPCRTDISSIAVVRAVPIVLGRAAELDFAEPQDRPYPLDRLAGTFRG